jgi:hypothetical protein
MLAFGRTSVDFRGKLLGICCFPRKVMNISYSFGTQFFSFRYLREFYCYSGIAGFVARWQDYAVTTISQYRI